MNLIEQLAARGQQARDQALSEYRDLLAPDREPQPTDADRLREVARTLDLDDEEIGKDYLVVREVAALERQVLTDDQNAASHAAAEAACKAVHEELRAVIHDIVNKVETGWLWHVAALLSRHGGVAITMDERHELWNRLDNDLQPRFIDLTYRFMAEWQSDHKRRRDAARIRHANPRIFGECPPPPAYEPEPQPPTSFLIMQYQPITA